MSLKRRLSLWVLFLTGIIFIVLFSYLFVRERKVLLTNAQTIADMKVEESSEHIKMLLEADRSIVSTLSASFTNYDRMNDSVWKKVYGDMYLEVFKGNDHLYSLWDSWELNVIDPEWKRDHGRYVMVVWRENGEIKQESYLRSLDGDPALYAQIKKSTHDLLWEPYFDVLTEGKEKKRLMTTISSPIIKNGIYVGIVAVDITLDRFQHIVEKIKPFDNSYAFLLSNEGKFVGHPNEKWLNTSYDDHYPGINSEHKVQDRIRNGKDFSFIRSGKDGKVYYSFAPIVLQGTDTPWSVGVCIPINTIHAKANDHMGTTILLGLIGLLVIITSIYYIVNRFLSPVNQMVSSLAKMSEGDISMDLIKDNSGEKRSEVNKMQLLLNKIVSGLIKKTDFARRIGEGDLNSELSLLSSKDTLGQSLLTMRDNLLKAQAEASERKKEDEKIQWMNKGIAQISDVLRGNTSDITELSEEIIVKVVKLLNVNQGGIFLKEDDAGVYYELKAAFAYDRKKYTDKSIKPGEGLLGACILERETIHLTEIPQNYIEITSGLGGANPTSLLIVPLKTDDDEIMGVIEVASFKEFLPHQISFVERIAESIASTIRSVRTNHHTNELLRKTQMQTEEMASKEEELRQNMEELQATQDEMNRARAEVSANNELMEKIIDLVPFPVFVKDHDFRYTLANQEQSKLFNMLPAQMIGKSDVQLLTDAVENENIQNTDLEVMTKNKKLILPEQKLTTSDGARRYLQTIKVPFKNNISGKTNILGVSIDRSDLRNAEVRIEEGYQEITRLKKLLEQS